MAHHIAVTLWVAGVFDIPRIGRSGFFSETWQESYQWRSMEIFLSNLRSIFSFHCHSCIVNEVIFEDDTCFFLFFFYFTDILTRFNRISPSCVTKRYHFMDVKRIFLLKEISSTFFFYQMSIYLIITKYVN